MNGCQRIRAVLEGRPHDGPPVMLHNFMMAAAEAGVTMAQYRRDPVALARCHIEAVEKYGYDGILVDVDTVTLAGAAGVPVLFPEDEPAVSRGALLSSLEQAPDLEPADVAVYPVVQVWLEAVRILKRHFGDEVYLRGNCDQCPFSLASCLRGAAEWMMDLMDPANEEADHVLLEYCTGVTEQFLALMAATGCHMLSNGDSPAGPSLVSPRLYRTFAWPYEKRIAAAAHHLGLPYALHICGKTEPILEDMAATGAGALELDYKTDVRRAAEVLARSGTTFIGNLDPSAVVALGAPAEVETRTAELIEVFAGSRRFILNAGCAIPASTPPANIHAMIHAARRGYQ
jgi:uroporphyrinogen decarboxylase